MYRFSSKRICCLFIYPEKESENLKKLEKVIRTCKEILFLKWNLIIGLLKIILVFVAYNEICLYMKVQYIQSGLEGRKKLLNFLLWMCVSVSVVRREAAAFWESGCSAEETSRQCGVSGLSPERYEDLSLSLFDLEINNVFERRNDGVLVSPEKIKCSLCPMECCFHPNMWIE